MLEIEKQNPNKIIQFGISVAGLLNNVIKNKKKPVVINGEQFLEFEDWQMIARFYGCTAQVEWVKEVREKDHIIGYEARAVVLTKDCRQISAAESMCLKTEKQWQNKELFQLKSMSQTRACAKSLRNVFSWVVVLAGFSVNSPDESS